ncbi:MAG: RNA 2',3'-cyclic phosphodiesterase [Desulfurococcaceae archaeon]|nr:RNA 2',3'-cyclic phosphodiesterase [Desulfurococcaceae archaeon]
MLRLFIAVEVEDVEVWRRIIEFRDAVASCSIDGGIKPVEDENIHLTLRFIGEVPETYLPKISECVQLCSNFAEFTMSVRGVGAFPNLSRPRVIWVGVKEGVEVLRSIRNTLERCVKSYAVEDREEFVPHITVARVKGRYRADCLLEYLKSYEDRDFGITRVTQVKLKRSQLTPRGPIYTDLVVARLKSNV